MVSCGDVKIHAGVLGDISDSYAINQQSMAKEICEESRQLCRRRTLSMVGVRHGITIWRELRLLALAPPSVANRCA